jgi:hypothetical protein
MASLPPSLASAWERLISEAAALMDQPGAPSTSALAATLAALLAALLVVAVYNTGPGVGAGNRVSCANLAFGCWVRAGRARNLLCSPCDRWRGRYPVANTCQIPFFKSVSDIYTFVFGYRTAGLFVEVGAYDGESFSNTSCLADVGWAGHYVEPIPKYAAVCAARHAGNAGVRVHTACVGERDGEAVELSTAGPFSRCVGALVRGVGGREGGRESGWVGAGRTVTNPSPTPHPFTAPPSHALPPSTAARWRTRLPRCPPLACRARWRRWGGPTRAGRVAGQAAVAGA